MVDFSESESKLETPGSAQGSSAQNEPPVKEKIPATNRMGSQDPKGADSSEKTLRKPFPWPFWLALSLPIAILAVLAWGWNQEDYIFVLRVAWIALCGIPGLYVMVVIGSFAQLRQRPFLSSFSLLMGGAVLGICYWAIQKITETPWLD